MSEPDRHGAPAPRGPGLATLVWLWMALAGLGAGAYYALPWYMDGLEGRMVYASPDCLDLAQQRAATVTLPTEVRGDSLQSWMMTCLEERQARMGRRADLVGYGTSGGLLTFLIVVVALTLRSIWRYSASRSRR